MANRYWKADKETSAEIIRLIKGWAATVRIGNALAKENGGVSAYVGSNGFSGMAVLGFQFVDESKVDKKVFCRLKGTRDGWRPRRGTSLDKEFDGLRSYHIGEICKLIGMEQFGADGLNWHSPGVQCVGKVAYLSTPDYVNAKGCERISDIEYERLTKEKKRKAS